MFTGIVEELGTVEAIEPRGDAIRITIGATTVLTDVEMGASIAVNGCCLTVVDFDDSRWMADAVPESMDRTTLGVLASGDQVNLERPVRPSDRLGGHIVQGHVDGRAAITAIEPLDDGSWRYRFALSDDLAPYVVEKGSITLDGISLTVAALGPDWLEIAVIPHTAAVTTLGQRTVGQEVNVEVDVLAKYVERQLQLSSLTQSSTQSATQPRTEPHQ